MCPARRLRRRTPEIQINVLSVFPNIYEDHNNWDWSTTSGLVGLSRHKTYNAS